MSKKGESSSINYVGMLLLAVLALIVLFGIIYAIRNGLFTQTETFVDSVGGGRFK